ncbi:MAG: hypothetical protein O3C27_10750 [Actinomycetota bacterium]|nr:hypothetical protein [Actinomycetota bacterium]
MEPASSKRRSLIVAVLALGVAAALAMAVGGQGPLPICSAEGILRPDGDVYGRDPSQACAFVDDQGELVKL